MKSSISSRQAFLGHSRQSGQALVESLVAVLGLSALWAALHWLSQYQDMALSALHASRHAAFLASRAGGDALVQAAGVEQAVDRYFAGRAHQWRDRHGEALLQPDRDLRVEVRRLAPISDFAQPGGAGSVERTLRRDWLVEDGGMVQAGVTLDFAHLAQDTRPDSRPLGMVRFDLPYPRLERRLSLLVGAGHAQADGATQARVGASGLAWSAAYSASRAAGGEVAVRAEGVDTAWNRPGPEFDWLAPWSGRVPSHLIANHWGN